MYIARQLAPLPYFEPAKVKPVYYHYVREGVKSTGGHIPVHSKSGKILKTVRYRHLLLQNAHRKLLNSFWQFQ